MKSATKDKKLQRQMEIVQIKRMKPKSILYEKARLLIRDGDILLYRVDKRWSNMAIAYFGDSPYVHAGMAFWSEFAGRDRLFLAETIQYWGGRYVPMSGQIKGWPGQWDVPI